MSKCKCNCENTVRTFGHSDVQDPQMYSESLQAVRGPETISQNKQRRIKSLGINVFRSTVCLTGEGEELTGSLAKL